MQIRTGNRKASRTGLAADSEAAAGPAIPNALFLYRQSDKLPEKAFNHLAGFGMLYDHSGQRTGLAPNGESIPALLALRSPANRVQQSHRRQDPSPEPFAGDDPLKSIRQKITAPGEKLPKLSCGNPLFHRTEERTERQIRGTDKKFLGSISQGIHFVRPPPAGLQPGTCDETIAFECKQMGADRIFCKTQVQGHLRDGAGAALEKGDNIGAAASEPCFSGLEHRGGIFLHQRKIAENGSDNTPDLFDYLFEDARVSVYPLRQKRS
jgi:hypothetical protein